MNYWTEKNKFIPVVCKKESADDLARLKRADDPGRKLERNGAKGTFLLHSPSSPFPYSLAYNMFAHARLPPFVMNLKADKRCHDFR